MQRLFSVLSILTLAALAASSVAADEGDGLFRVTRLSDRMVVFTDVTPWESNHVVLVTDRGLVLFDPGHTPLMGRLIREAVARELGRDRFAYVVDTHEHWGHTWGAAAFPEAIVIGHELALPAIKADAANLAVRARRVHDQAESAREALASLDLASAEGSAAKLQYEHLDRIARGLVEPGMVVRPPDLTFSDRMELDLGDVTLQMHYLGRGHSPSDIAVVVPEESAVMMGCFFYERDGLPTFGTQPKLDPDRWLAVLSTVLDAEPPIEHVILGQHSIWPRAKLAAMRDAIAATWSSVKASDAEGLGLEAALGRLPAGAAPAFLRDAGVSGDKIVGYTRTEATALWRQLKLSAADEIQRTLDASGIAAATARFKEIEAGEAYFVDEAELNALGYRYLQAGGTDQAIAVFEMNVAHFPESWNVYDSLGEAYAAKGDRARAIQFYRRSLELNPANTNGTAALDRLTANSPS
jgi:glyoxylase-like metal-dependent hydrolase (beta-lactamase superfamily II)